MIDRKFYEEIDKEIEKGNDIIKRTKETLDRSEKLLIKIRKSEAK